jgi:hypothetical protein
LVCGGKKKPKKMKLFFNISEKFIISIKAAAVAKGSRVIILLFVEKRLEFSRYLLERRKIKKSF